MLYTIHWKRQYNGNKLKAWLFQGLRSFSATQADRCIERDKTITNNESNCHWFLHQYDAGDEGFLSQTDMWDETRVLYLEPKSKQQSVEWPNDIPKDEEIQECAISWKNQGCNLLRWQRRCSCELLPWRTTMNSDHCTQTLRNLNPCPQVHTTR